MRPTSGLLCFVVALLLLSSCISDTGGDPVEVGWHPVSLPVPPGPEGRLAVRDAVECAGRWYLVGGVFPPGRESRPAAWSSTDGRSWATLPLRPKGYWARRSVLSSVACRDGEVAMVGAKSGGAHGNPRVATWYERAGVFVDVNAGLSLYGGPQAVSVGRIAAGPSGWLISGNRTSGPAVWLSDDAMEFRILEGAPHLSNDQEGLDALALDQVHDGEGWTVVGNAAGPERVARVPVAWVSPDGESWARQPVPETEGFNSLERVIRYGDGLVAAGLRGERFGLWTRAGDTWRAGKAFGTLAPDRHASPCVCGLAAVGSELVAAVSDGERYGLWASSGAGSWRRVRTPSRPATAGEHVMNVAASGRTVLLMADDGEQGRVWITEW